jgi:hypothetical protein
LTVIENRLEQQELSAALRAMLVFELGGTDVNPNKSAVIYGWYGGRRAFWPLQSGCGIR